MATHSSILAWKILWIEEPGGLPSRRLQSDTTEHTHEGDRRLRESNLLVFLRKPPEKTFSLPEGCGRGSMWPLDLLETIFWP